MKKILIVIDMQNDFITGSLGTPEAVAIVDNVKNKIKQYNATDIFFTRDTHEENYSSTLEGRNLPISHCIRGSEGWHIHPEIADLLVGATRIDKPSFGSVELGQLLSVINRREPLELELIGLCTDICIMANAMVLSSFMPEVPITVDSSCCAGSSPEAHDRALESLRSCLINVI